MKKPQSYMRELRKAQVPPLTLKELASKCGVSYTTVWNLENGRGEHVSFAIHWKVAAVLGVDPINIFPSAANRLKKAMIYFTERNKRRSVEYIARMEMREMMLEAEEQRRADRATAMMDRPPRSRHYLLLTLFDFCINLKFEDETNAELILRRMTPDELGDLFHSGLTQEGAIDHLNRAALRLGLKAPELKHGTRG